MKRGIKNFKYNILPPHSAETLHLELLNCKLTISPLSPEVSMNRVFAELRDFKVVKEDIKRQVYYLETPDGKYFLKRSMLNRTKDKVRHFLLPQRRWAEWRNFHRLHAAQISVSIPVLKAESISRDPKIFFLMTKDVNGKHLPNNLFLISEKLGQYLAFLHSCGVYHADLHPQNILIQPDDEFCLIDVQEVYLLPWLPRWMKVYNLGKLCFHLRLSTDSGQWFKAFIKGYNRKSTKIITRSDLLKAGDRHQKRHYRSRAKRCCKNSTDFVIVRGSGMRGFKRREFNWGLNELKNALIKGTTIKPERVLTFKGVCIKIHRKHFFHQDRCLASWKMSRVLEVRDIKVPRSLAYFVLKDKSYFLSEYLNGSILLNDYLSSLTNWREKRRALKNLAFWVKKIHLQNIWQRDFKASNILFQNGEYFMVDLEGVKIRKLSAINKTTNLAQLNASISNAISLKDRVRFFYYYSETANLSRRQRRDIYQKVWKITQNKNVDFFGLDITRLKP
jgi:tRNA A-37 threonylcarbamoyl transferase component Bud32